MRLLFLFLSICLAETLAGIIGDDLVTSVARQGLSWNTDSRWNVLFSDNCFYDSQEFRIQRAGKPEDCRKQCRDEPRCTHVAWYRERCFLKAGLPQSENEIPRINGAMCGLKAEFFVNNKEVEEDDNEVVDRDSFDWKRDNKLKIIFANGCHFPDRDITTFRSTIAECSKKCRQREKCTHFSWFNKKCTLKRGNVKRRLAQTINGSFCGFKEEAEVDLVVVPVDPDDIKFEDKSLNDFDKDFEDDSDGVSVADTFDDVVNRAKCTKQGPVPKTKCKKYFDCVKKQQKIKTCPNNQTYDAVKKACSKGKVKCRV